MNPMNGCSLCFNVNELENCIAYQCNHTFCRSCTNKIIFTTRYIQCPIDKITIKTLLDRNQSKTVDQYKSNWWNDEGKSMKVNFEYYSYEIIQSLIGVVNTVVGILTVPDDVLRCRSSKNSHQNVECLLLRAEMDKIKNIHDFSVDFMTSELEFVKSVILKYPSKQMQPIEIDILNEKFELDITTIRNMLDLLYTHIYKGNEDGNERFQQYFQDKLKYLTGLAISHVSNNEHVYRMTRPDINEIDTNKCLICHSLINEQKFTTFAQCQHKLCLDCIDRFMITHGDCPFHGDGISHLQMSGNLESVSSYLTRDYQEIGAKLFHKYMNIYIQAINQMVYICPHISNLIGSFQAVITSDCETEKELEIKNIKNRLITIDNVMIHSPANEFCDNLRKLKYITMDFRVNDYLNTMIGVFYNIELAVINNCKLIFYAYNKLAKKQFNSDNEIRLNLHDFLWDYRNSSLEILQFNTDVGKNKFCIEIYGLIKKLQNVLRTSM